MALDSEESFEKIKSKSRIDSIIIFEDIQKYIFEFKIDTPKDFPILLINEYLDFLGNS
jgi:hypothetical protein